MKLFVVFLIAFVSFFSLSGCNIEATLEKAKPLRIEINEETFIQQVEYIMLNPHKYLGKEFKVTALYKPSSVPLYGGYVLYRHFLSLEGTNVVFKMMWDGDFPNNYYRVTAIGVFEEFELKFGELMIGGFALHLTELIVLEERGLESIVCNN